MLRWFALCLPMTLAAAASCAATQTPKAKAELVCTTADADKIIAVLADKTTSGAQKLLALAALNADITACVLKATAPPASSTTTAALP